MFDVRLADDFLNRFFANILPHLTRIQGEANAGQNDVAREYIKSNDPSHRKIFFNLESRIGTVRKMCQAYLEDAAATSQNKDAIYRLFPELLPKIESTVAAPPQQTAGTVTINKVGEAPAKPPEAHKGS